MHSKFDEMLQKLSNSLNLPLYQNKKGSCAILVDKKLIIQLEPDESLERLLIGCFVTELLAGKFRENVLLEALKENDKFDKVAIFAFNEKNSSLSLYNYLSLENLSSQEPLNYFKEFMKTALAWKEAISLGKSSPNPSESLLEKPFGLK
ncbi:MAG: CesT family type III secretion system chaperone [Chlamydiae bacterium]|nr:CesT family type III secretion system chaperone [Chlamydiota bacterium]